MKIKDYGNKCPIMEFKISSSTSIWNCLIDRNEYHQPDAHFKLFLKLNFAHRFR
ncbi:MAG: hypothetical protein IH840_11555 [Candidatus Heimdallarchaeota archaeon]|nr:hypothetical protein [Candidatus Heimdallarchaeota archaeon]